jgi:hypothetical protein
MDQDFARQTFGERDVWRELAFEKIASIRVR